MKNFIKNVKFNDAIGIALIGLGIFIMTNATVGLTTLMW